jgi:hypothetical protein
MLITAHKYEDASTSRNMLTCHISRHLKTTTPPLLGRPSSQAPAQEPFAYYLLHSWVLHTTL